MDDRNRMNDRQNENRRMDGSGSYSGRGNENMPIARETMPMNYRDDYRDIYRGYRMDRMHKNEPNIFKNDQNYKQYNDADEVFECIIQHLTKGVKFHDKMMDLYGFMGLYGFKKMHEYQYLCESMERRQAKCYVLDNMNLLIKEKCDEKGLEFIPEAWYNMRRGEITSDDKKRYVGPSFQGYKQWEEETKELLSYCANELMYMGRMADFNEVMEMVEDVNEEIQHLEKVILKLKSVDYDMQYVLDMQDEIEEKYNKKIDELFAEKMEEDKVKRKHKMKYSVEEQYQRRSSRTGRYTR